MCHGCWVLEGSPKNDTPEVRRAATLIADVYDINPVGGSLHVLLDDWNIDDGTVEWCAEYIKENPQGCDEGQLETERECLECMKGLTLAERAAALALHDGFWGSNGSDNGR